MSIERLDYCPRKEPKLFEDIGLSREELIKYGYRKVSNKSRWIARVDRPDWEKFQRIQHPFVRVELGADHYRRVWSTDIIIIPSDMVCGFPTSCHDTVGYVELI